MHATRIWTDAEGESHFGDLDIPLAPTHYSPPAPPFGVSEPIPSSRLLLMELPSDYDSDWHPTPVRQWFLLLAGEIEVDVTDGESRGFAPGARILVEDLGGLGHRTRSVGGVPVNAAFVHLPEESSPAA